MKNKLAIASILILTQLLTGCSNTLKATAATGKAIVADSEQLQTINQDHAIRYQINHLIVNDPVFKDSHITAASFNRNVLLVGQTPHASVRVTAEALARSVKDVKLIYNEITINPPSSLISRSRDAWLTTKVKTQLIATKGVDSNQVKVVTEDSVVYLMGKVPPSQAGVAINVTRRIKGVQKVVKVFS